MFIAFVPIITVPDAEIMEYCTDNCSLDREDMRYPRQDNAEFHDGQQPVQWDYLGLHRVLHVCTMCYFSELGHLEDFQEIQQRNRQQFLTVHYPLYYKIILMISTKIVDSAFKGSFYLNVGAINCPSNIR